MVKLCCSSFTLTSFSLLPLFLHHSSSPRLSSCFTTTAPPGGSNVRWCGLSLRFVSASAVWRDASLLLLLLLLLLSDLFCRLLSSLIGRSHTFRPQIVKSIARPTSPSPFSVDAPLPLVSTPPVPKSHPSTSESGNLLSLLCASFFILLHIISHFSRLPCPSSLLSSGAQGAWLTSGADITPVPLLSSPDLDALCDPVAPALAASLPRSSPPHSSSYSTSVLFSSPRPQLVVSPSAPPAPPGTSAGDKLPLSPTVWDSLSDLTFALRRLNVPLQSSRQGDSCELRFRPDQTGPGFKDGHHRKQSWTGKDQVRSCVQCLNLDCLVWLCG